MTPIEAIDRCSLTFEGQENWVGSYREAKNQKSDFLSDQCAFCLEDFDENAQVILFPCTHGLHEHCFESWQGEECPYDKKPVSGVIKAHFCGYSVLFPAKTKKFAIWLANRQEEINRSIHKILLEFSEKEPEKFSEMLQDAESRNKWGAIIQAFIQDCLLAYDQSIWPEVFEERTSHLLNEANLFGDQAKLKKLAKQLERDVDLMGFAQEMNMDPQKLTDFIQGAVFLVALAAQSTNFTLDMNGIASLTLYLQVLLKNLTNDPNFIKLGKKVDRRFLKHHLKAISNLAEEKYCFGNELTSYLNKMDKAALERLGRLTPSEHPLSDEIKENIKWINLRHYTAAKVKTVAVVCGIAILGASLLWP